MFGGFLLEVDEYMEKKRKNTRLVDAESGLKMRAQSSMEGDVQCVIPYEDSVLLLEEQTEAMTIGGRTGVWSLVQWNEKTGWVFGGFLTESITDTITVDGIDIEVELYKGTREELLEMFTPEESYRYNFMLILAGQYESVSLAEDKKQKGKYGYAILRDLYGVFDYECGELIFKTNNSFTCFPESDEPFTEYMSNFEIQRYIKTKTSFKVWTKKNDRDLIIFSSGHLKLFNKNIKKLEVGSYKGMNFLQAIEKLNNDGVPYYFIVSDSSEDQKNGGVVFGQQINYYGMYKENLLLFITEPDYIPKGKVFGLFKTEISDFIMDKKVEVIAVSGGERTTLMSMPHPGGKLSIPYILDENAEIIVLVDGEQRIKEKVEAY
ncbi:MAG: SH3 domain-containing protein [Spirochaetia bacterium]